MVGARYNRARGNENSTFNTGRFDDLRADTVLNVPHGTAYPSILESTVGRTFYNTTTGDYAVFDGIAWIPLGGAAASSSKWTDFMVAQSPEYNAPYSTIQSAINAAAAVATAGHPRVVLISPETYTEDINVPANVDLYAATSSVYFPRSSFVPALKTVIIGTASFVGGANSISSCVGIEFVSPGATGAAVEVGNRHIVQFQNCKLRDSAGAEALRILASGNNVICIFSMCSMVGGNTASFVTQAGATGVLFCDDCSIEGPFTDAAGIDVQFLKCVFEDHNGSTLAGKFNANLSYFGNSGGGGAPSSITVAGVLNIVHCEGSGPFTAAEVSIRNCSFTDNGDITITGNTNSRIYQSSIKSVTTGSSQSLNIKHCNLENVVHTGMSDTSGIGIYNCILRSGRVLLTISGGTTTASAELVNNYMGFVDSPNVISVTRPAGANVSLNIHSNTIAANTSWIADSGVGVLNVNSGGNIILGGTGTVNVNLMTVAAV